MRRLLVAVAAVAACLALAAPASAEPSIVSLDVWCDGSTTMLRIETTGLAPGEQPGYWVESSAGVPVTASASGLETTEDGYAWAQFGADFGASGTYTLYAYTGPWQTFGDPGGWPGAIQTPEFDPSLTTSLVSTTFESTCGPPAKEDCKMLAWQDEGYRNQGQCVSASAPGRTR